MSNLRNKQQRKKLAAEHKMVRAGSVSMSFVCKHDRLLWPCPTVKHLWELQEKDRRTPGHANKSA